MATLTTPPDYGYQMLPLFDVSSSLLGQAATLGITIEQGVPGTFRVMYKGQTYGSQAIKGNVISLAKSKQLGPASKQSIQYSFEGFLKLAIAAACADQGVKPEEVAIAPLKKVSPTINPLKAKFGGIPASTPAQTLPAGTLKSSISDPNAKAVAGGFGTPAVSLQPAAPLSMASEPYQKVQGTSPGSNYYVLAVCNGMNVAVRIKSNSGMYKLSIRAEGENLLTYSPAFSTFGMDMGTMTDKSKYYSAHFDIDNSGDVLKALGAVLGYIGFVSINKFADPAKLMKVSA